MALPISKPASQPEPMNTSHTTLSDARRFVADVSKRRDEREARRAVIVADTRRGFSRIRACLTTARAAFHRMKGGKR